LDARAGQPSGPQAIRDAELDPKLFDRPEIYLVLRQMNDGNLAGNINYAQPPSVTFSFEL